LNSRRKITELTYRSNELSSDEQKLKRLKRSRQSLRDLLDIIKWTNLCSEEGSEKEIEKGRDHLKK
jgi:hypothetical protein